MPEKPVNILVVDDDEVDVEGIRRAFAKNHISNPLHFACDGIEALDYLQGNQNNSPLAEPYILLVDLNMPRLNGIELIKKIRDDSNLRRAIIFAFTTSNRKEDIQAAYDLNVAGYIVKSNTNENLLSLVKMLNK